MEGYYYLTEQNETYLFVGHVVTELCNRGYEGILCAELISDVSVFKSRKEVDDFLLGYPDKSVIEEDEGVEAGRVGRVSWDDVNKTINFDVIPPVIINCGMAVFENGEYIGDMSMPEYENYINGHRT